MKLVAQIWQKLKSISGCNHGRMMFLWYAKSAETGFKVMSLPDRGHLPGMCAILIFVLIIGIQFYTSTRRKRFLIFIVQMPSVVLAIAINGGANAGLMTKFLQLDRSFERLTYKDLSRKVRQDARLGVGYKN